MTRPQLNSGERVIRVRLGWILLGALVMIGLGGVGGMAADWLGGQPLAALPEAQDRLLTTIQEVTISPSMSRALIVEKNIRSTVLLAVRGKLTDPLAAGAIVTSDGIVATTATLPDGEIVAVGEQGEVTAAERVGVDAVFGITYLRLRGGVFVPVDMRDSDVPVGYELLALSRNPLTLEARVGTYTIREYQLPESNAPIGWQRLYAGTELSEAGLTGSPLFDDEGRVAALALRTPAGTALPSVALRQSLARVVDRQLDKNRFEELGLRLAYVFEATVEGDRKFLLAVTSVKAASRAAASGLAAGDRIEKIHGEEVSWDTSVLAALSERESIALQVRRGEQMLAITIAPAAAALE